MRWRRGITALVLSEIMTLKITRMTHECHRTSIHRLTNSTIARVTSRWPPQRNAENNSMRSDEWFVATERRNERLIARDAWRTTQRINNARSSLIESEAAIWVELSWDVWVSKCFELAASEQSSNVLLTRSLVIRPCTAAGRRRRRALHLMRTTCYVGAQLTAASKHATTDCSR